MKIPLGNNLQSDYHVKKRRLGSMAGGMLFTAGVACLAYGFAELPYVSWIGPMLTAILLTILYRQWFGYPEAMKSGIEFTSKKVLRLAIVLYGFRLNIHTVLTEGWIFLLQGAAVIGLMLAAGWLLARLLRAERGLSFLLAVGTGVCGAAAIAAVSPLIKAKDEDTAISVGLIAAIGTVFALFGTVVLNTTSVDADVFAAWMGLSLHEIAHVAAAAAPAGEDGLALALLAKLGRVLLLVPLCLIIAGYMRYKRRSNGGDSNSGTKDNIPFPWFLAGFAGTSVLGTYAAIPAEWIHLFSMAGSFLMACAMAGLGLHVDIRTIRRKAVRPLGVLLVISILLSGVVYWFM